MFTPLYVKSTLASESVINKCKSFIKDERGVTAVEYAIIAVAMSAVVLAVFHNGSLKNALDNAMGLVSTTIGAASKAPTP
ncbi:Flp family type IVb pilin [Vibrio neonatus]|uniref:Flp family type IVb pilin n=1 Tax=Vibrio neonatus TaxID=278860 RepID=UPI0021C4A0FD|nr:Flp family type IVb pilin [Vibrio neonatus]